MTREGIEELVRRFRDRTATGAQLLLEQIEESLEDSSSAMHHLSRNSIRLMFETESAINMTSVQSNSVEEITKVLLNHVEGCIKKGTGQYLLKLISTTYQKIKKDDLLDSYTQTDPFKH
jgi:hypothetical protein